MQYIIAAQYPYGFTIRLNPEDPNYLFSNEAEAQAKVDELQNNDTEGIQYYVSPIE